MYWMSLAALGLGLFSIAVPFLGDALGLSVDVSTSLEVADHVIPGGVAALAAGWLAHRIDTQGIPEATAGLLFASGVVFLAGLWISATHLPLIVQGTRGEVGWPAALWHSWAGLPIMVLGIALFFAPSESEQAKDA